MWSVGLSWSNACVTKVNGLLFFYAPRTNAITLVLDYSTGQVFSLSPRYVPRCDEGEVERHINE